MCVALAATTVAEPAAVAAAQPAEAALAQPTVAAAALALAAAAAAAALVLAAAAAAAAQPVAVTAIAVAAATPTVTASATPGRVREARPLLRGYGAQGPGRAARGARAYIPRTPVPALHVHVLYACLPLPNRASSPRPHSGAVLRRRQALSGLAIQAAWLLRVGSVECGLAVHT